MSKITDDQVAALRAALAGAHDEHSRIYDQLTAEGKRRYTVLVVTSFLTAADRKFGSGSTKADVVRFVGDLRTRYGLEEEVDPSAAEHLLLATFSEDVEINEFDHEEHGNLYIILLAAIVREANLSDSELKDLLARARKLADEWLTDAS